MRTLLSNLRQNLIKLSALACCLALQNKCEFSAKSYYCLIRPTVIDERYFQILNNYDVSLVLINLLLSAMPVYFSINYKSSLSFPYSPSTYSSSLAFLFNHSRNMSQQSKFFSAPTVLKF